MGTAVIDLGYAQVYEGLGRLHVDGMGGPLLPYSVCT